MTEIKNLKFKIQNWRKGFTLIELIIVIGILGILATAALAILNPFAQFQKADDAKRKADLSQIQKALESYYQDYQRYPAQNAPAVYKIQDSTLGLIDWGAKWGTYMNVVPKDPVATDHYVYYSPDGQSYCLYASLERNSDPALCKPGDPKTKCTTAPATGCGNGSIACNFGVCSPNILP